MLPEELFDSCLIEGRRVQGRDPDRIDYEQEPLLYNNGEKHRLHEGQKKAWASNARHVAVIAGRRAGKTCLGPHWALREIQRTGGGDGLVVGPSYPIMERRLIPECRAVWEGMGEYKVARKCFEFNEVGCKKLGVSNATVWFGHAEDPESLESMRARWCWRDETGQSKFSAASAEAIEGRLAQDQGRIFDTTTPYEFNWFKSDVWDKRYEDPEELEVFSFLSKDNPSFPLAEWERQKKKMQPWRFAMMYEGKYTRPAGAVIDCFDKEKHVCESFVPPLDWKRVYGVDFGQIHTFVVCAAEHPTEKDTEGFPVLYCYHEHFPNKAMATWQHVKMLKDVEKEGAKWPPRAIGGARGERDWRSEWTFAGLPVEEPWQKDFTSRIDRSYAAFQRGGVKIMEHLRVLICQIEEYSWEVDDGGEPIPGKVKDQNAFHAVDALFYMIGQLRPTKMQEPKIIRTAYYGHSTPDLEYGDWWDDGE